MNLIRTANQMYEYATQNGFNEGTTFKWGIKHYHLIEEILERDEIVRVCFIGLHKYESLIRNERNYAYCLTNQRFIMAQKGLIDESLSIIPLEDIISIEMNNNLSIGYLTIKTMNEKFNIGTTKTIVRKIYDELLKYFNN